MCPLLPQRYTRPSVLCQHCSAAVLFWCSSTLFSTPTTNAASVLRSSDQLHEVVTLACELLPPLPDASTVMLANLPSAPQSPQGTLVLALESCHVLVAKLANGADCVGCFQAPQSVIGHDNRTTSVPSSCSATFCLWERFDFWNEWWLWYCDNFVKEVRKLPHCTKALDGRIWPSIDTGKNLLLDILNMWPLQL